MTTHVSHRAHARLRPVLALAAFAACTFAASAAFASPLFEHTGGVMGTGGFNARFTQSGTSAAYFNPAMLTRSPNGISVGTFVMSEQVRVSLGSREGLGVEVPIYPDTLRWTYEDQRLPFDQLTFPTTRLNSGCPATDGNPCAPRPRQGAGTSSVTRAYALIGLVNRILGPQLVVGFHAMLPLGQYTTANSFFVDEREQFFSNSLHPEMYGDRLTAPSLGFGIGSEVIDGLSIGLSFTIALLNSASAGVYVSDAGNQADSLLLATNVGVVAKVAPHLGITYDALDDLTLSFTAHSPSRFAIETGFANLLANGDEQIAVRETVHDYMPWLFALGAEYGFDVGAYRLAVVGGATLGLWSNYINRMGERPLPGYEWSNTVSPTIGVRLDEGGWRIMGDLQYLPTPVPRQTGRTNYVDNNRLSGTIGGEYDFVLGGLALSLGASVQGHYLFRRSQDKITPDTENVVSNPLSPNFGVGINPSLVRDELPDSLGNAVRGDQTWLPAGGLQTNNPGYPGYASDGFLWGAGIHLSIYY